MTSYPVKFFQREPQTCLNAIFQMLHHSVVKLPNSKYAHVLHHDFELKSLAWLYNTSKHCEQTAKYYLAVAELLVESH